MLGSFGAGSVVDIGCGVGTWLRAFAECGVQDIAGYDGSYIERARLMIAPWQFNAVDLRQEFPLPRRFDIAVSLEVAEHLPHASAAGFVRLLAQAALVGLFSAAIPQQGGTEHVNEQWPDYWRALFAAHSHRAVDCIGPMVRGHPDVE